MLQIISAVIKDSEDKTNISLLFANQVWVIFHSFFLQSKKCTKVWIVLLDKWLIQYYCKFSSFRRRKTFW